MAGFSICLNGSQDKARKQVIKMLTAIQSVFLVDRIVVKIRDGFRQVKVQCYTDCSESGRVNYTSGSQSLPPFPERRHEPHLQE